MRMMNDKTTIFVCRDHACDQPTNDLDKVLEAIGK
jgi:hypothetical protein